MSIYISRYKDSGLDHALILAFKEIYASYGDSVKLKDKSLQKFGKTSNADSGVWTTVMELPGSEINESYVTTNTNPIDKVVSSSGSDTGTYTLEGHTNSSGNLTFVVQNFTLTGQTPVTLSTPLNRVSRIYPISTQVNALVGNIQVYNSTIGTPTAGVVSPNTAVHIQVLAGGSESSQKAATSFSSVDYGIIEDVFVSVLTNVTGTVDCRLMIRKIPNNVWRQIGQSFSSNSSDRFSYHPHLIIPKNHDVRLQVKSNTNNTVVTGGFTAYIATII